MRCWPSTIRRSTQRIRCSPCLPRGVSRSAERRAPGIASYTDVTSFPEVREDLAVVVPEGVTAAEVLAVVRRSGGSLLAAAEVFDVYRDPERVGAGKVSLAVRLSFRGTDRTLTDQEVAKSRDRIARALEGELGGSIRAA